MKPLEDFLPEKSKMVDSVGRYLTQSLFLELGYNEDAIYTLKDNDHFHNGRLYISAKRLYLSMEDPTEYQFANVYFCGWKHWLKMTENKAIRRNIDEWREELELKLRAKGVKAMIQQAHTGSFQASKWLTDRGWEKRGAGRPSKDEVDAEKEYQTRDKETYGADVLRMLKNG
jgi:hypothetical protein